MLTLLNDITSVRLEAVASTSGRLYCKWRQQHFWSLLQLPDKTLSSDGG